MKLKTKKFPSILGNRTFSYFRNRTLKKLLIFQEATFRAQKMKKNHSEKFLIFWEMELSSLQKLNKNVLDFLAPKNLNKTILILLIKPFLFTGCSSI